MSQPPPDSTCEVLVNGVTVARTTLDGAQLARFLAAGVNPLPRILRGMALRLERMERDGDGNV